MFIASPLISLFMEFALTSLLSGQSAFHPGVIILLNPDQEMETVDSIFTPIRAHPHCPTLYADPSCNHRCPWPTDWFTSCTEASFHGACMPSTYERCPLAGCKAQLKCRPPRPCPLIGRSTNKTVGSDFVSGLSVASAMVGHRERSVPVQSDERTLEQRQRDMMSRLRHRYGRRASTGSSSLMHSEEKPVHVHVHTPDWTKEINRWIDETHNQWDGEIKRLRNDMFPLVPMDLFGMGGHDFFAPHGDVRSVLDRMDRQMRALARHMEEESQQAALENASNAGALVPRTEGGLLDFLKDAYQLGEDGRVHFKVRFDLQGYGPNDVQVSTSDNGLSVNAKKIVQTDQGSSSREYSRTLYLPQSIDRDNMECHLTQDGVLTVEAPVKTTDYKSITFDRNRQLGIKPRAEAEVGQQEKSGNALAIQPIGVLGPTVVKDEKSGGEKLHVEIPVDPEFSADDLCVRTDAKSIVLSGRKEVVDETGNSKSVLVKEFSRSYDVPETVDAFSVNAELRGGKLLVEAPLLCPAASK
ncbi:major egg antigen [Clonorchis sinensis]|uniref:Major egg antigen n=1 Tax=Clonorchis sinensis TaxID=79923 RepID=G7YE15_CLOSI|nr:major egg antigen [Clonorchis sinensis]